MIVDQSEYNKLVIYHFEMKKEQKTLSLLLTNPTRLNIKKACINRYKERNSESDHILLRDFFGPAEPGRQCLQLIENFNVERFRTLNNYLKKETYSTDNLNIELLAWLIDFKYRPFSEDKNLELNNDELAVFDKEEVAPVVPSPSPQNIENTEDGTEAVSFGKSGQDTIGSTQTTTEEKSNEADAVKENPEGYDPPKKVEPTGESIISVSRNKKRWKIVAAAITTIVIFCAIIFLLKKDHSLVCAYWNGDQYQEVACSKEGSVKIEREKIRTFRRIRDEQSIKEDAIGKVHYIKDGEIKYYTEGGWYPDDTSRTLKKLTRYMYDKYLNKKDTTRENDLARQK